MTKIDCTSNLGKKEKMASYYSQAILGLGWEQTERLQMKSTLDKNIDCEKKLDEVNLGREWHPLALF